MILQVHDELVLEVPEDEVDAVAPLVVQVMEAAFDLDAQLVAEAKVGKNWRVGEVERVNGTQMTQKNSASNIRGENGGKITDMGGILEHFGKRSSAPRRPSSHPQPLLPSPSETFQFADAI